MGRREAKEKIAQLYYKSERLWEPADRIRYKKVAYFTRQKGVAYRLAEGLKLTVKTIGPKSPAVLTITKIK